VSGLIQEIFTSLCDMTTFQSMTTVEDSSRIAIVDDDDLMRSALQGLLKAVGLPARAFASAEEFSRVRPAARIRRA